MPSIGVGIKAILKGIGLVDDVVDTGKAAKLVKDAAGGGDDVANLDKVRRLSAAILEIAGGFLSRDKDGKKEFLGDEGALRRVTNDYYNRLDEAGKDQYEKVMGEVWGALCDGLGMRKLTQPQQKQEKGQQQQKQPPIPNILRELSELDLNLAVRVSLGKAALAAATTEEGDLIIKRGLDRLRQASIGEKAGKAALKGIDAFTAIMKTINDTLEEKP